MKIDVKTKISKLRQIFTKDNLKKAFTGEEQKKHLKQGSYSSIMTVIIVAVVIAVNLVFGQLPSSATQIDVSEQKLYTLSDDGKKIAKNLSKEVILYYYVKNGSEDDNIAKLLNNFKEASSNIKVETIDPDIHPTFTSQYTSDTVNSGSVIVVCGDKSKVLDQSSLYESEVNYQTMSQQTTGFDGEGQIASALSYVTNENMPVLYTLTGHEETELGSNLKDSIEKANMEIKSLNLLTSESVPEDADVLLIGAPQKDLTKEEAGKVISYLENGGKVLVFTGFSKVEMPNLDSVLTNYGLERDPGLVIEGDSQHYYPQYPDYLIPNLSSSSDMTSDLAGNTYVLVPDAQAIKKLDNYRNTLTITSLITTTDSAYIKNISGSDNITAEKADGDEEGAFDVGVSVSESVGEDKEAQLVYFSSVGMLSDDIDNSVSGGNVSVITKAITSMTDVDESTTVSIPSKSLSVSYLNLTAYDVSFWSLVTMAVIPVLFLLVGFVIWMKRRKQ